MLDDLLAEPHGMLVDDEVGSAALGDGAKGFEHRWVGVPENVRPRTEQIIDVLVAAHVPDVTAFRLADAEIQLRVEREAPSLGRKEPFGLRNERALFLASLDHAALLSLFSRTRGNRSRYSA